MARRLKVPSEKFRDKLRTSLDHYVASMRRLLAIVPLRRSVARLIGHVEDCLGVVAEVDAARADEAAAIAAEERHLVRPEWSERVGRRLAPASPRRFSGRRSRASSRRPAASRRRQFSADGVYAGAWLEPHPR